MHEQKTATPHQITLDQPLPGFYPCITMQLNVTRYASGKLGRFVLVLREPSSGLELRREFAETGVFDVLAPEVVSQVESAMKAMVYLQDGERTN